MQVLFQKRQRAPALHPIIGETELWSVKESHDGPRRVNMSTDKHIKAVAVVVFAHTAKDFISRQLQPFCRSGKVAGKVSPDVVF